MSGFDAFSQQDRAFGGPNAYEQEAKLPSEQMTLEQIHTIYDNAYKAYQRGGLGPWSAANAERYALHKVVTALRDATMLQITAIGVVGMLNKILASNVEVK